MYQSRKNKQFQIQIYDLWLSIIKNVKKFNIWQKFIRMHILCKNEVGNIYI